MNIRDVLLVVMLLPLVGCFASLPRFPHRNGVEVISNPYSGEHELRGLASYYADKFHGRLTASGEVYDMYGLTAAHKTLPFGTIARVTNLHNGLSVVVTVNDRGPFVDSRVIDLSLGAAREVHLIERGTSPVSVEIIRMGPTSEK